MQLKVKAIVLTIVALLLCGFLRGGSNTNLSDGWRVLPVGGGGNVINMSIANDGKMIVGTDVGNGFKWNANGTSPAGTTGVWEPLVTSSSMPAIFASAPMLYASGIYTLAVAPSDSTVMYMAYPTYTFNTYPPLGTIYRSTDGGQTWAVTGFTPDTSFASSANDTYRNYGPKMAVDPNDPTHVYFGVPGCTYYYSSNSGSSWSTLSGPPTCGAGNPPSGIVINPQDSNMVYVAGRSGGVYRTTTGAAGTWTNLTTGTGPTGVYMAAIDGAANGANSCNGYYYAVDTSAGGPGIGLGNLWVWNGTTWGGAAKITGNVTQVVVVDPTTSGHVIAIQQNGKLNESTDCGSTWSGWTSGTPTITGSGDVGWIAAAPFSLNVYGAGAQFDRSNNHKIYMTGSSGFWYATWSGSISSGTVVTWQSQTRGIEEMVGNNVTVPPGGKPIVGVWDFGALYKANNTSYSTIANSNTGLTAGFGAAWSIDWPFGTPTFLAMYNTGLYSVGGQTHEKSTDGGQTWSSFTPPGSPTTGNIAVSTTTSWVFSTVAAQPQYTTDGGASWNPISMPGVASWVGLGQAGTNNSPKWVAADRVNALQYTVMFAGVGFFKTTDGGANWTKTANAAAGGGNAQLKSVPGQANNLFWSQTAGNGGSQPGGSDFQYSQDAGATWTKITNANTVSSVGFGAVASGQSYPSIYIAGWVVATSTSTVPAGTGSKSFTLSGVTGSTFNVGASVQMTGSGGQNMIGAVTGWSGGVLTVNVTALNAGSGSNSSWTVSVYGIFRSIAGPSASLMAWKQLGTYPNGNQDTITWVEADYSNWGYVYLAFKGTTAAWGYFNFLLKRDLDPASNDNDPMWLERVA